MTATDNTLIRAQLTETDDSGEQQVIEVDGRAGEHIGGQKYKVWKVQGYGFSAHAPKGSQGVAIAMNGNPDQAMVLPLEHPEHRPKELAESEWKLYDAFSANDYLYAQEEVWTLRHDKKLVLQVGSSTITILPDKIVIKADEVITDGTTILDGGSAKVHRVGDLDSAGDAAVGGADRVFA